MKTRLCGLCSSLAFSLFLMFSTGMIFSSCQDDLLEDSYPEWLGSSIYGELEGRGNFKNTLRLIDDLEYAEVLKKTGSKTVFVADDDAWQRFFAKNEWNVSSYEGLSLSQKKWIFKNSMINAPILEERLASAPKGSTSADPNNGMWMRRANETNVLDTLIVFKGEDRNKLPKNSYWDELRQEEVVYMSPPYNDNPLLVALSYDFRENKQVTDEDMKFIFGDNYNEGVNERRIDGARAVYLWDDPVVEKDVTCQNGYIHILRDLLVAPNDMAAELAKVKGATPATSCSIFNEFLDRYTLPLADAASMLNYNIDGIPVYRKAYFAKAGSYARQTDADNQPVSGQLEFDPSWRRNHYATGEVMQENMSAIFVPTDEALETWWNTETGKLVMNGLSSWDEVPNDLLARLINNHMKTSFLGSLPSIFDKILNDGNREQGISMEDIATDAEGKRMIYPANNGVIYVVNKVYTPDSYISVMAPCLNVDDLKVMGFAVTNTDKTTYIPDGYGTYLNSMESKFTFVVPTDEALLNYVNPFYVGVNGGYQRVALTLTPANRILATWTQIDGNGNPGTTTTSDFYLNSSNATVGDVKIQSILKDILDNCIVVMKEGQDFSKGGYYQSKGGEYIYISDFDRGATVQSGGNIERGETPIVSTFYNQSDQELVTPNMGRVSGSGGNGVTMAVDGAIQPTLSTVYDIISKDDNLSEFANLLAGSDNVIASKYASPALQDQLKLYQALILPRTTSLTSPVELSRDEKVGFLGNYNYTLYAPNNAAMQDAYRQGLPKWEDLAARPEPDYDTWTTEQIEEEEEYRQTVARKILNFIRFHFQDNSIFTDAEAGRYYYKTQAFNDQESVFYELQVDATGNDFTVTSREVPSSSAKLVPNATTVNKMAREYQFDSAPARPTSSGSATKINSSSKVAIHAVDAPLFFSPLVDGIREQFK